MAMISHLHDILDAIIDSIMAKLSAMPFLIRHFFKILYQESMKKYAKEYGEQTVLIMMSNFLIKEWLSNVCFNESQ
jgi:hypothetical protein